MAYNRDTVADDPGSSALVSSRNQTLYTSPPTPPLAFAEDGLLLSSPTISAGSTAEDEEGAPSPVLPSLPEPTFNGHTVEVSPRTPPRTKNLEEPTFYTASWGSPYQKSTSEQLGYELSDTTDSENSNDFPLHRLELQTPFLKPGPSIGRTSTELDIVYQDGLKSATVLANRARRKKTGLIEDWIRKHTGGETAESNHWLSDVEQDETSSLSGSITSPSNIPVIEEKDRQTPTLKRYLNSINQKSSDKRYRRQRSASTLRPEDFFPMSDTQKMALNDKEDEQTVSDTLSQHAPSPPPKEWQATAPPSPKEAPSPPPKDWQAAAPPSPVEAPSPPPKDWQAAALPSPVEAPSPPPKDWQAAALPSPVEAPAPEPAPIIDPPVKIRVPWHGRIILIGLPPAQDFRDTSYKPKSENGKDIQETIREREIKDNDTRAFDLGPALVYDEECTPAQSRAGWPSIRDMMDERQKGSFTVCIPDKREWDLYVQELQEAKLRSLGVSHVDPEPISPYPLSVPNMSRHPSFQYPPLPFSPTLPTSSVNSSHANQNPFSPTILPGATMSTNQGSHPPSIASPLSINDSHHGKFNSRHSISVSTNDQQIGSPFQYAQQQSQMAWPSGQVIHPQGLAVRGRSPSLQKLGAMISPASPFSQESYFSQMPPDVLFKAQERQKLLQKQYSQLKTQLARNQVSPHLQKVKELQNGNISSTTKISPKIHEAQLHNQSLGLSFQEEFNGAEYHLESQIQRELEHEDYSPHSEKGNGLPKVNEPLNDTFTAPLTSSNISASRNSTNHEEQMVLHHPKPHSRNHSIFQNNPDTSTNLNLPLKSGNLYHTGQVKDSQNTNPGSYNNYATNNELNDPQKNPTQVEKNPQARSSHHNFANSQINHRSKASLSTLNVAAKEFNYKPSMIIASKPALVPPASQYNLSTSVDTRKFSSVPLTHASTIDLNPDSGQRKINYPSSTFLPGNSDFNFSIMSTSFGPTARGYNFNNSAAYFPQNNTAATQNNSIFGNIDINGISFTKPSRKSKAIPIISPDNLTESQNKDGRAETEDKTDSLGEERIKRVCDHVGIADSVPVFAEPSLPIKHSYDTLLAQEEIKPNKIILNSEEMPPHSNDMLNFSDHNSEISSRKRDMDGENSNKISSFSVIDKKQSNDFADTKNRLAGPRADEPSTSLDEYNSVMENKSQNQANGFSLAEIASSVNCKVNADQNSGPEALIALESSSVNSSQETLSVSHIPSPVTEQPPLCKPERHCDPIITRCSTPPLKDMPLIKDEDSQNLSELKSQSLSKANSVCAHEFFAAQTSQDSHEDNRFFSEEQKTFNLKADDLRHHLSQFETTLKLPQCEEPEKYRSSPVRCIKVPDLDSSSPVRFVSNQDARSAGPSPSPRRFQALPGETKVFTRIKDDASVKQSLYKYGHVTDNISISDWDDIVSEAEKSKVHPRAQFFDNHVDRIIGGILAERLSPLEQTLQAIQKSFSIIAAHNSSSHQGQQGTSVALSDADDEDDNRPRLEISSRWEKRMDKIKAIINESIASSSLRIPPTASADFALDSKNVLQALQEIKSQLHQAINPDVIEGKLENSINKVLGQNAPEKIMHSDNAQEARISFLEHKLKQVETWAEEEINIRRAAENQLSEIQRQLRISSEEEHRLREAMEQREVRIREILNESDAKVRLSEEKNTISSMRVKVLESAEIEYQNRIKLAETDLRASQHEVQRLRIDAECALEAARRHSEDAEKANEMNKDLTFTIERLKAKSEESIRVREVMRGKLIGLQEDMTRAALKVTEEIARRVKREQEFIARQDCLEARLQAESRTRERLETEINRLETGERDAMRAVADCKKLEPIIAALKEENHMSQKDVMRLQRELDDAKASGLNKVQRAKQFMQAELDSTKHRMHLMREEFERQISTLRTDMEQTKMDADTAREKHEMLLEGVEASKKSMESSFDARLSDTLEDIEAQHNRRLQMKIEEAQRAEQNLLDRLSISAAKTEHLQDRVVHLEEKLEIANAAAAAAATAAKTARSTSYTSQNQSTVPYPGPSRGKDPSGRISPRAFRESIMSLQEQIQQRESTIETLNSTIAKLDPDAPAKISKRDDEIMWLRELLAVRKSDLTDIVQSLEQDEWDVERVKDAAIRLRTNLQMQEQELERAINGGSALPNLAASLRDVANPRVAQAVGPLVAVWGSWRKSRIEGLTSPKNLGFGTSSGTYDHNYRSLTSSSSNSLEHRESTPKPESSSSTPRFSSEQLANRPRAPIRGLPPKKISDTRVLVNLSSGINEKTNEILPILKDSSYDQDAVEELSDAGFYDEDSGEDEKIVGTPGLEYGN